MTFRAMYTEKKMNLLSCWKKLDNLYVIKEHLCAMDNRKEIEDTVSVLT